jgi:hypothetical protein
LSAANRPGIVGGYTLLLVEYGNPGFPFIISVWIVLIAVLFGDNTGESVALLIP